MARMQFNWDEPKLNSYDNVNPEDLFTALPDDYKQANKPLLVFVTSDLPEDGQEMMNVDATVLRDESVAIGATMFRTARMNGLKIKDGHPYWKTLGGNELPRMVVVDTSGRKVGAIEGKDISVSKVYGLMKRAAAKTYKADLDTIVKETKTILTEIDQVEAKRQALETKKAKSTVAKTAEWAKEEKDLNEALKRIEARETELKKKWSSEKKVAKA